jgi:hypothetical protein
MKMAWILDRVRWLSWIARYRGYLLILTGIIIESGLLFLIILGNLTAQVGGYVAVTWAMFGVFWLAAALVLARFRSTQRPDPALIQPGRRTFEPTLAVIIFFAVLFRLTSLFIAPTLSTDQFRYTWEGRLVTLGVSPYQYAPDAPALAPYHSPIWPLVQQRATASPYPPLSQLIGAGEYLLLGDSLLGPKLAATLFDLLICLALLWLLKMYGMDARRLILYAWCPLPIIEFGQSGHNDAAMLFLLAVAVGLAVRKRPGFSAFVLGLACLAKFTPLFGLPLFMVAWRNPKEQNSGWNWQAALRPANWRYPLLTVGVVIAGYIPFLIIGGGTIGSIFEYTGSWLDNENLIYQVVNQFVGALPAKIMSVAVLGTAVALLSFHPRLALELSLPRRLMLVFGVTLLVASTVHTWYLSWILLFVPLVYGSKNFKGWDNGWMLAAALLELPYLTYNGNMALYGWIRPLEYWPLHLLVGWNVFSWWRAKQLKNNSIILKKGFSNNGDY